MFKFIDLFCGIGGFRLGLEAVGGRCVWSSDIDKWARITYYANHHDMPRGDITAIPSHEIPDHDLLCGGFPCQPFSLIGLAKRRVDGYEAGLADKKKGSLVFEILRILRDKQPRAYFLENVPNLRTIDKGKAFKRIRESIEALGYSFEYKVLSSEGLVPQRRKRLYMVGFRDGQSFDFPTFNDDGRRVKDILIDSPDYNWKLGEKGYIKKKRENFGTFCTPDQLCPTLTARYSDGPYLDVAGVGTRKFSPRECARLMGFPDSFEIPCSTTQSYRQFGNSVVVPVIATIGGVIAQTLNTTHKQ